MTPAEGTRKYRYILSSRPTRAVDVSGREGGKARETRNRDGSRTPACFLRRYRVCARARSQLRVLVRFSNTPLDWFRRIRLDGLGVLLSSFPERHLKTSSPSLFPILARIRRV